MVDKNPGLDEVMSDEKLAAFTRGRCSQLEEPPPRRWPVIAGVSVAAIVAGFMAGVALAPYLTVAQVAVLVGAILVAVVVVAVLDRQEVR